LIGADFIEDIEAKEPKLESYDLMDVQNVGKDEITKRDL
jgi:hypothetical protein